MARKFGKKNKVKLNMLDYNLGLLGESGIGKSTLAKELCEKLVGEDGYIIANLGLEDGVDAIDGAMYENIPDWKAFDEFTKDIIENKNTDYKDLKVVVYDTVDELFRIAEAQAIKLHNRQNKDKQVKSINSAFGGFGKGQDKVIDIVLEKIWKLKDVGVKMIVIGHTKKRTQSDPITGIEYDILTNKTLNKYFDAIKTKLHILGVASVDRIIAQEKVKNKITNKESLIGKIAEEARIITFRDDSFNVDSKSRFKDIVPKINFDTDEFIKAIEDAIKVEYSKNNDVKNLESDAKKQTAELNKIESKNVEDSGKDSKIAEIQSLMKSTTDDKKKALITYMTKSGHKSFKDVEAITTEQLNDMLDILK